MAMLMIGGSGRTDRDETVPPPMTASGKEERLFCQLANAAYGCAVPSFRYDKRGVLNEKGDVDEEIWKTADREHLISDALDAARFVLERLRWPLL